MVSQPNSIFSSEWVPNPDNVGLGLPTRQSKLTAAYSPTNFLYTETYGIAPSNTSLTVRYLTGGGVNSNVNSNTLTGISTTNVKFNQTNLNPTTANYIFSSLDIKFDLTLTLKTFCNVILQFF